jgi:single-stranded DNA-specific DHH superfamily exonuclease
MHRKFVGGESAPLREALRALAEARGWSEEEAETICAFLGPTPAGAATGVGDERPGDPRTDGGDPSPFPPELRNAFRSHPAYSAARDRIGATAMGHRIILFGDYDADGITAVAQVHRFLAAAGRRGREGDPHRALFRFVPDRMRHGYGLTKDAVDECLATCREEWAGLPGEPPGEGRGRKPAKGRGRASGTPDPPILLIALDCGSASLDVVAELKRTQEVDTIVVDHHQSHDSPDLRHPPVAHLNPQAWEEDHPGVATLRKLSASGLAFLLCDCLREDLQVEGWDREAGCVLAGLGTVADVVPLVGPNRVLVKEALRHANEPDFLKRSLPGLAKLHERSGGGPVDARTFGYRWGPRVNASGRIEDARAPVELLLTSDPARIGELAAACERANDHRKKLTEEALDGALQLAAERERTGARDRVLVLGDESWEPGIVGIVAGRLRERLGMPVIVLGKHRGQEAWKGSGRSVAGYDLGAEVRRAVAEEYAVSGGGHHLAAGLTVAFDPADPTETLENLRAWLNDHCSLDAGDRQPVYEILAMVHADEALLWAAKSPGDSSALVKFWCGLYDHFEPFGAENPRPGLLLKNAELLSWQPKTTMKGVKITAGAGVIDTPSAPRVWAISARFRCDGVEPLIVDWTDIDAARAVWPDPKDYGGGVSSPVRCDLVLEPHCSTTAAKPGGPSRTWYDWRVVACARHEPEKSAAAPGVDPRQARSG